MTGHSSSLRIRFFAFLAAALAALSASAVDYWWTGNGGDGLWSTAGNWATDDQGTPATAAPKRNDYAVYHFEVPDGGLVVTQDIAQVGSAVGILSDGIKVTSTASGPVEMKIVSTEQNASLNFRQNASIDVAADVTLTLNTDMGGFNITSDFIKNGAGTLAFDLKFRTPYTMRGLMVNEGRVVVLPTSQSTLLAVKTGGTDPANPPVLENQLEGGVYGALAATAAAVANIQLGGTKMVVGDKSSNDYTNKFPVVVDAGTVSFANERIAYLTEKAPKFDIELDRADVLCASKTVVCLPFNDTSLPQKDVAGCGSRLLPVGTPAIVTDAVRGSVLSLDGTNGFKGPDADNGLAEFNPNDGFTLSMWLKPDATCDSEAKIFFFGQGAGTATTVALRFYKDDANKLFYSYFGGNTQFPTPNIRDGNWHHVAVVFNGTKNYYFFYDGVHVHSWAPSNAVNVPNRDFFIGHVSASDSSASASYKNGEKPYIGLIDDFFLSNRLFAYQEIRDLYSNGLSRYAAGPTLGAFSAKSAGALWVEDGSVSAKTLSGTALNGGIELAKEGSSLTVGANAGEMSTEFQGAISGNGASFVKCGADYDLTLAGKTKGVTNVVVNAGSLTLSRPRMRRGLVSWYSFDDPADFGHDDSPGGFHLAKGDSGTPTAVDGVRGKAIHFGGTASPAYLTSAWKPRPSQFPTGNDSHTVSCWIRPTTATCTGNTPIFCWGSNAVQGRLNMLRFDTTTQKLSWAFSGDDYMLKADSVTSLANGAWHHVVATYDGETRQKALYCDGQQIGQMTILNNKVPDIEPTAVFEIARYGLSDSFKNKRFEGDMDEFMVFDYAWSADEVAAEYNHVAVPGVATDAFLPAPVARWTFDGENPLADTTGNPALTLSPGSTNGTYAATVSFVSGDNICGKAVRFSPGANKSGFLKLGTFPESIVPYGNTNFSVVVRFRPDTKQITDGAPCTVGWGATDLNTGKLFRMGTDPDRACSVRAIIRGTSLNSEGTHRASFGNDRLRWYTAVFVYHSKLNGQEGHCRIYSDGVLAASASNRKFAITPEMFSVGSSFTGNKDYAGLIDDIQIYDCALSDGQVRLVTEQLEASKGKTSSDAAVPAGVLANVPDVTVASGATLKVSSTENVGNLSGAGAVEIAPFGRLNVVSTRGFEGSVSGAGVIGFADGAALDIGDGSSPLVDVDCAFALGANVTVSPTVQTGRILIAEASSFLGTENLESWTANVPAGTTYRFVLSSDGTKLYLSMSRPTVILVKGEYNAASVGDPIAYIREELSAGKREITIPKASYMLTTAEDEKCYLELDGINDVTIDFSESELVGTLKMRMFTLVGCTNVTLRNVVIDYADLPFTQATIETVGANGTWDVRVIQGYPCPDEAALSEADFWPIQAYDGQTLELKNPMRYQNGIAIARTGADTYRITGGVDTTGDVGDIAVWSIKEMSRSVNGGALVSHNCKGCTFENMTIYSTPVGPGFSGGITEFSADGNRYVGCSLMRRPPENDLVPRALKRLRSGNHDAFDSRESYKGPTLEQCTFQYHCDDCVNISGYYAFVTEQEGRTLRIAPYAGKIRIAPGDTCQLMTFEGNSLPDVTVVSVTSAGETTAAERSLFESYNLWSNLAASARNAFTIELDADRELPPGSVIISNRRMGNGFVIRDCTMGHNRGRGLMIKASDGLIEGNLIECAKANAVQISMEYEWMEGGCSKNVTVRNNVFRDNGGGVYVAGSNGARNLLPADSHRDIAITGNTISGSVPGIGVIGCTGLDVRGNTIELPDVPNARAMDLTNVADVLR